jgi:hypothetical protein
MTWTKERLQSEYNLASEDVIKTLKVCGLPLEQDEYSDEEIEHKFQVVRDYFDSNRTDTYTGAADLFMQEHGQQPDPEPDAEPQSQSKAKKSGRRRKTDNSIESNSFQDVLEDKHLDISELLYRASEKCGTRIKLSEATAILAACGLPDQDQYSQAECDRFSEACDQIKNQGRTDDEVAAQFGAANEQSDIQADVREILGMIGSAAVATESDLLHVLNELSVKRGRAISEMYDRLLLTQVAQQLKERQKARAFLADFGERLEAYVEGKSPVRAMKMLNPTSSDQSILKILPSSLDNS